MQDASGSDLEFQVGLNGAAKDLSSKMPVLILKRIGVEPSQENGFG